MYVVVVDFRLQLHPVQLRSGYGRVRWTKNKPVIQNMGWVWCRISPNSRIVD